jgi:hypothetical protein
VSISSLVIAALALVVLWMWRQQGRTEARLHALDQLLLEGWPSRETDLTYLERRLLGLRSQWKGSEVPLDLIIETDSLEGLSFGMNQGTVEAEVARRSGGEALAQGGASSSLYYCIMGARWLGVEWAANLTIEGGRLVEIFLFRTGELAPGLRELVDTALQKRLGQPLALRPAPESLADPHYVALASAPSLQQRKSWEMRLGRITLNVSSMGDDANVGVSVIAER